MSFDPSFQYTQGFGAGAPDPTDTIDITGTPAGVDPSEDPTKNEYYTQRLLTPPWIQAGFPDYASYARNLQEKEANARALQEKSINATTSASGANAAASNYATQERGREFDLQAQADAAKQSADQAHQAALLALSQGDAEQARKQFDISSQELARYHSLDIGIRQQEANTSTQTAGYNIYKDLTDKASNPRNFMEQFFKNRGQPAPPNAGQYSNTATGPQGIMPFEQWLPNFMSQTLGSYGTPSGAGAARSPVASAPPPGPAPAGGYGGQNNPSNPYAGTNINYGGSPTTADTALINGVKTWAGGAYSGQPVASSPADAGDLTQYLKAGQAAGQARAFADGGTLRMTAPHAIINMLSGKVAAIAGEQPGRGPQGFVPETAKFDGQAILDPLRGNTALDPLSPDGTTTPAYTDPAIGKPLGDPLSRYTTDSTYTDPGYQTTPIPELTGAPIAPPAPPPDTTTPPPAVTPPPATTPAVETPPPGYRLGGPGEPHFVPLATTQPPPPPVQPPTIFTQPKFPVNQWGGPQITPTTNTISPSFNAPSFLQNLQQLSQTPSGLGKNPVFLPEDQAAQDPILASMLQQGTFPPFLQRIFAQQKGLAGLGTNVPQQTDLPNDVPLISQLALNQMSPSEFQAFQSFLSAHGIDWNDYIAMVQAASPQGGASSSSAVPKFLSQGG